VCKLKNGGPFNIKPCALKELFFDHLHDILVGVSAWPASVYSPLARHGRVQEAVSSLEPFSAHCSNALQPLSTEYQYLLLSLDSYRIALIGFIERIAFSYGCRINHIYTLAFRK
jgi:hypothetical protein